MRTRPEAPGLNPSEQCFFELYGSIGTPPEERSPAETWHEQVMAKGNRIPKALAGLCPLHSLSWGCDPLVRLTALGGNVWRRLHQQPHQYVSASPELSQVQTKLALRVGGCELLRRYPQPVVQAQVLRCVRQCHLAGKCHHPLVDAPSHLGARLYSFTLVNAMHNDR